MFIACEVVHVELVVRFGYHPLSGRGIVDSNCASDDEQRLILSSLKRFCCTC